MKRVFILFLVIMILPVLVWGQTTYIDTSKTAYVTAAPEAGLVAHWTMDSHDVDGTTLYDKVGDNNGTLVNTPTTGVDGKIGEAIDFENDNSEYIDVNNPVLGETAITISCWAKKESYVQNAAFVADWAYDDIRKNCILGYEDPENTLTFYIGDGSGTDSISKTGFTQDVWHHIVGVFEASTLIGIYIDGSGSTDTTTITNIGNVQSSKSHIGAYRALYYFDGLIDDVRIYNRALSATEITQLYNASKRNYIQ